MYMKPIGKLLLISFLFLLLCLVFYVFDTPLTADALSEDQRAVVIILDDGELIPMTLAEYLPGVLAAEIPASFEEEALKAQAVAARTYVLSAKHHAQARVCTDSTCCLAFQDENAMKAAWGSDFEANYAKLCGAVAATDGQYLAYGSEPIQAVFHASSGGRTENSDALWSALPYLVSVETPETAATVPGLISTVTLPPDELADTLGFEAVGEPSQWLQDIRIDDAGRVKGILLCGQAYTGPYLRQTLGLLSTDFALEWDGTSFVFTVTGHGHGVGMSQYGANLLAADGWTYKDILSHYYPGTILVP